MQIGLIGKIGRYISFPGTLDASTLKAAGSIDSNPALYTLSSVIVHIGGASVYSYGHYICYMRTSENAWYKCDDDEIEPVSESEVAKCSAYMLFYQRSTQKPSPHELALAAAQPPAQLTSLPLPRYGRLLLSSDRG